MPGLGVQAKVFVGLQFCGLLHVLPLYTHHLYSRGRMPPVAVAVKVIAVPAGCGLALSAVRLVTLRGGGAVML